ncbi:MAG: LysR family transcriptional regulator [Gammaproteobacteria bacterium]|nr:MAG: LysR family transcriptional regulator [Gammaproteobacteria bacterium]
MDWVEFPTLNSLRAFSAVAETSSFSRAAVSLNVTHAAVSQQVKALEERIGLTLIERKGKNIGLTTEGKSLAHDLATGFTAIHDGVKALTHASTERAVQVTMPPAFAVSYLMPRIAGFQREHPEIRLMLNPTADIMELTPGGIEVAIRYCDGVVPGMVVIPLLKSDMVVVGARELVRGKTFSSLAALCDLPWLQEVGSNDTAEWMGRQKITPDQPMRMTYMPGSLIMDAVRRGHGLTFTARSFVDKDIQAGLLVELFSESDIGGYYIVTRPGVLRSPVLAFVNWLNRQSKLSASH